jgi:hypothetical protein
VHVNAMACNSEEPTRKPNWLAKVTAAFGGWAARNVNWTTHGEVEPYSCLVGSDNHASIPHLVV